MGLCKCPKRVVTNQFCYEHKVNVCEYCMVTNHPKCIVLSYLKWLQDGDYNPICDLCSKNLTDEECVRLVCYLQILQTPPYLYFGRLEYLMEICISLYAALSRILTSVNFYEQISIANWTHPKICTNRYYHAPCSEQSGFFPTKVDNIKM